MNLHSNMYLFRPGTRSAIGKWIVLYLHSTMYLFQQGVTKLPNVPQYYLHSTMYLFQPNIVTKILYHSSIYIPLCIYFNLLHRIYVVINKLIYIPLCIYFNYLSCRAYSWRSCIYIPLCIYFNLLRLLIDYSHGYLHSTMYLFQLEVEKVPEVGDYIYIPLCIYFNCADTLIKPSIYLDLHSTMYLFQRI